MWMSSSPLELAEESRALEEKKRKRKDDKVGRCRLTL